MVFYLGAVGGKGEIPCIPKFFTPFNNLPYLTIPYLTKPYHTMPHLTIPYLTIPYHTMPHLTIQYPPTHHSAPQVAGMEV